jgi:hypothetical protein
VHDEDGNWPTFCVRRSIQPNQKSCVERHNAKSVILHAWIVKITSQKEKDS